jgi:hypothetical protein
MKQTAVEWLQNELFTEEYMRNNLFEIFEQAKEMEKQQIIDAYVDGFKECEKIHEEVFFIQDLSEQYYNENFKNKHK